MLLLLLLRCCVCGEPDLMRVHPAHRGIPIRSLMTVDWIRATARAEIDNDLSSVTSIFIMGNPDAAIVSSHNLAAACRSRNDEKKRDTQLTDNDACTIVFLGDLG